MTIASEELLTRKQAQHLLRVTGMTLYRWTKAGKVTPRGDGRRNYYVRAELEALMLKPKI